MKTLFIISIVSGCIFSSCIAFANVISLGQSSPEPTVMLFLGLGLLGIAGIGKKQV